MNQKVLMYGGLAAIVILLAFTAWYLGQDKSGPGAATALPDHKFENWDAPIADPAGLSEEAQSLFGSVEVLTYEDLLRAVKRGDVSLVSELWALRRQCPDEMERYDCNIRIRQFIMDKFAPPGNEQLVELFTKYLKYEEEMSRFKMPDDLSLKEQYMLIREKRRELFGSEDAQLVFGLEEAKADYAVSFKGFTEKTAGMSGDDRMAAYEQMRREAYGDYYDSVIAREPKFSKYETEVSLRDTDLSGLAGDARSAKMSELRTKYFGKEGAQRMAAVDAQIAQRDSNLADYKQIEADFLANNAELQGEERDAKLLELRVKHFGQEEGEAYSRREKYEQAMRELRESRGQ